MTRFVTPDVVRCPLSGGDWIDVKRELNVSEQRRIFSRSREATTKGVVNPEQYARARAVEYLIAWSFVDAAGKPVALSEAALDSLSVAAFREINDAIEDHETAHDEIRSAEKNATDGGSASHQTLPSPVDAAGGMSGSVSSTPTFTASLSSS